MILFFNQQRRVRVSPKYYNALIRRLCRYLKIAPTRITVALVDDRTMRQLNQRYRGRHHATDVLSFPADRVQWRRSSPPLKKELDFLGDVIISVETAQRNARRAHHPLKTELAWLILHGVLHLLGYDHVTDQGQMTRQELRIREKLL